MRPDVVACKLVEIASTIEPVQDGRIHIELVNLPFLRVGGTPEQYRAGIKRAIEKGWFELHESGSYLRFTQGWGGAARVRPMEPSRLSELLLATSDLWPAGTLQEL